MLISISQFWPPKYWLWHRIWRICCCPSLLKTFLEFLPVCFETLYECSPRNQMNLSVLCPLFRPDPFRSETCVLKTWGCKQLVSLLSELWTSTEVPPIGIQLAQRGWSLLLCKDVGEKDEWKCETTKLKRVFICLSVCFIQPQCNFQNNFPRSWISFHTEHCHPAMEYHGWYFWLFAVTVYAAHNITCPRSSLMPRPLEACRLFWVIVSICPLSPTSPC